MEFWLFSLHIVLFLSFSEQICKNDPDPNFLKCTSLEDLSASIDFKSHLVLAAPINGASNFAEFQQFYSKFLYKIEGLSIHELVNGFSAEAFKYFPNLQYLRLERNKIDFIGRGVFKNLKITNLFLQADMIKVIEKGAFENLTHLRLLSLMSNNLTSIKRDTYVNLPLEDLSFYNNQIEEIERLALVNLPRLKNLHLNLNRLNKFTATEVLDRPETLEGLYLNNNELMEITASMLEGLESLRNLYLDHNFINRIESKSFHETPKLANLIISFNQLTILGSNIFPNRGLEQLTYFALDHNRLTFLPSKFLKRLPNLGEIKIGGNPWQCACLDIILFWLEQRNINFECDVEDFYSGKRPACVVPDGDDARVCQDNFDIKLWLRYDKFYSNYSRPEYCG